MRKKYISLEVKVRKNGRFVTIFTQKVMNQYINIMMIWFVDEPYLRTLAEQIKSGKQLSAAALQQGLDKLSICNLGKFTISSSSPLSPI